MSDPNQLNDPHGRHGYDPRQPRVPAGQSTGGQWTDADGSAVDGAPQRKIVRDTSGQEAWNFYYNMYRPDGSLAEQVVFNRDRSRIISEFNESGDADDWDERHTVITPDGNKVTFETNGDTQTVYDADGRALSESKWTEHGPEAQAIVQPAYAGGVRLAAKKALEAALALLPWLSTRNSRDGTAVLSFAADVYRPGIANEEPAVWVGRLTEEELKKACQKHGDVQAFTDKAAADARTERKDWRPSAFGTEVHKRVAHDVNGRSDEPPFDYRSPDKPKDPNFRAEYSALKAEAAAKADPNAPPPGYGDRDTIRVDVLEHRPDDRTVCLYDIKTGERVLTVKRIEEIARSVAKYYQNAIRIIVTEIRPQL